MGKKAYIGVNGAARKVKRAYVGVGGVARKVKKAYIGVGGVARLCWQAGTPVGTLPVGSIVQIRENGALIDYLIVHQGLPSSMYDASCNGTWVLRKNSMNEYTEYSKSEVPSYSGSTVDSYLNSTVLSKFDVAIQNSITQVIIPYCSGIKSTDIRSGGNGLKTKIFHLAGFEVGFTKVGHKNLLADGTKLSYFEEGHTESADNKRIAVIDNWQYATTWPLRTLDSELLDSYRMLVVSSSGSVGSGGLNGRFSIRPAFVLPPSLLAADGIVSV